MRQLPPKHESAGLGLTVTDAAQQWGVARPTLSRMRNGQLRLASLVPEMKKGQSVKIGLDSSVTRMVAGFFSVVPGAGIEPARLAAGDFESPLVFILQC